MSRPPRFVLFAVLGLALAAVVGRRSCRLYPRSRDHDHDRDRGRSRERPRFADRVSADQFQRGNLHAHSLRSDGTATLESMVDWYREHGYQFLATSEHDLRVDPAEVAARTGPGFVVLPAEEVTDRWEGRPLHVNALCVGRAVEGNRDFGRADVGLATMFAQIRAEGGIPLVNHPNFHQSLTGDDVARGASGRYLLEIWSGHPDVAPAGDGVRPSAEALWDEVLARGADVFPAAVDDAHQLPDDAGAGYALPGRAWVQTFGDETSQRAICAALAAGRLYASNGPAIRRIAVEDDVFTVVTADPGATVAFVGPGGATLAEVRAIDMSVEGDARRATYRLEAGVAFVRARVSDAQGRHAWTAAYRAER